MILPIRAGETSVAFADIPKDLALRFLPDRLLHYDKKVHYARVVQQAGEADEPDLRVLNFLVEPGQSVMDIGANIGIYSRYLSQRVGPTGHVLSVEPIPLTYDIFRSNLRKLNLRNVEARNCAVSDAVGEVTMHVPKYDSGGENFYGARIDEGGWDSSSRSFVVKTETVDHLLASTPVHFIKCDVEGHELSCIKGAAQTIARSTPAWLIEISGNIDDEASNARQTTNILQVNGLLPYWFDGEKLRIRSHGANSINYFFLTAAHVENIRRKGLVVEN
jgi:FkbM family methyltransferase